MLTATPRDHLVAGAGFEPATFGPRIGLCPVLQYIVLLEALPARGDLLADALVRALRARGAVDDEGLHRAGARAEARAGRWRRGRRTR